MSDKGMFISTRGGAAPVSFGTAMLQGLAPDGGLYVPASVPAVDYDTFVTPDFASFAEQVLRCWIGTTEVAGSLNQICRSAFNFEVPLVPLSGGVWQDCTILELFHGPTHSFKDFGARFMARAMARVGDAVGANATILVATSGDTGSAVADGFSGQPGVNVILLYPKGQVSPTQELQLIKRRDGVSAFRVDGSFDDCQRMVKSALSRFGAGGMPDASKVAPTSRRMYLSSANSINVGRLLPQMTYYAWAVARLGGVPTVCVPSGNLGNLTAGIMAHLSGLAVARFIAAHNANSFFPEYLLDANTVFRASIRTYSNAMDVGAPSNFERVSHLLSDSELRALVHGVSINDTDTIEAIRQVYAETGYVADPHTAVGLQAVKRYRYETGRTGPVVVLATAHPAKFGSTVEKAIGISPVSPDGLMRLDAAETSVRDLDASDEALEHVIRTF